MAPRRAGIRLSLEPVVAFGILNPIDCFPLEFISPAAWPLAPDLSSAYHRRTAGKHAPPRQWARTYPIIQDIWENDINYP